LSVTNKSYGGEEIDDPACKGYYDHDGHLLPVSLVDNCKAKGEGRDEKEEPVFGHWFSADGFRRGIVVDLAVYGGPYCQTET